jgi:hypothetical protein
MFDILNGKIYYYNAPKCACTTVKAWVMIIKNPEILEKMKHISEKFNFGNNRAFKMCVDENPYYKNSIKSIKRSEVPLGETRFCVVRDPVERFISTFKHLILKEKQIDKIPDVDTLIKALDDPDREKNYPELKQQSWFRFEKHVVSQCHTFTTNSELFTNIYNIGQLDQVKMLLEDVSDISLPDFNFNATKSISVAVPSAENVEWIKNKYRQDYEVYGEWF